MYWLKNMIVGTAIFSSVSWVQPAFASFDGARAVVECGSRNFQDNFCRIDTFGGVRLIEQRSRARCDFGSSWTFDQRGIYVRNGCAGVFAVGLRDRKNWDDRGNRDWDRDRDRDRWNDGNQRRRAIDACIDSARQEVFRRGFRRFDVADVKDTEQFGRKQFEVDLTVKAEGRFIEDRLRVRCVVERGVVTQFNIR